MKRKSVSTPIVVIAAVTAIFSAYMNASTLITGAQEQSAFDALTAIVEQEKEKQQDTKEEIPNNQTIVVLPAIARPENETGTEQMILAELWAIYLSKRHIILTYRYCNAMIYAYLSEDTHK